jgi:hypothetical protein
MSEFAGLQLYVPGDSVHTTIQAAINAAAKNPHGGVWIRASYSGTDTYTNPAGVPIFDLRFPGSISLTAPSTSVSTARYLITGATALTSGSFAISGWGTGATVTGVRGSDAAHTFIITAGTAPGSSPTIALTFADGPWATIPIIIAQMVGGTGTVSDFALSPTAAGYTLTYDGIPVNGLTYTINVIMFGSLN